MSKAIEITKVTFETIRPNKDDHAYDAFVAYTNVVDAYNNQVSGFGDTEEEAIEDALFFADLWINTFKTGTIV